MDKNRNLMPARARHSSSTSRTGLMEKSNRCAVAWANKSLEPHDSVWVHQFCRHAPINHELAAIDEARLFFIRKKYDCMSNVLWMSSSSCRAHQTPPRRPTFIGQRQQDCKSKNGKRHYRCAPDTRQQSRSQIDKMLKSEGCLVHPSGCANGCSGQVGQAPDHNMYAMQGALRATALECLQMPSTRRVLL